MGRRPVTRADFGSVEPQSLPAIDTEAAVTLRPSFLPVAAFVNPIESIFGSTAR
jgi:hypothetical protein